MTTDVDDGVLRIADMCVGTKALGPGTRSVVWVQGCPFRCRGCISPEWIPESGGRDVLPADLVAELLVDERVDGLTFSGGEPMAQAAGLAAVARIARRRRDLSVVCFTGFSLARLRKASRGSGVPELLDQVDVLIDGTYVAARNSGRGMRGSTNQTVHHLTDRLSSHDFEDGERQVELRVRASDVMLVGVPPDGLLARMDQVDVRGL